jgi:hypothetical protein
MMYLAGAPMCVVALDGAGKAIACNDTFVQHMGRGLHSSTSHFSAQLEPCLSQENTLHTLHNPLIRATQPQRAPPIPYKALKLS